MLERELELRVGAEVPERDLADDQAVSSRSGPGT
jgi:hypothetical protein